MEGVVILGAGLSGLGCALSLPESRIFEASDHAGGHAFSHEIDGMHFDEGAHICHSKDERYLQMIYAQAGKINKVNPCRATNFWHGQWVNYPVQNHLSELPLQVRIPALTDLVMAHVKKEATKPKNYHEWCLMQYGEYLTENFYAEYTKKYWRIPMKDLATDWLAGRLLPAKIPALIAGAFSPQGEDQAAFATFHYPAQGGYFQFFKSLYGKLKILYRERAMEIDTKSQTVTFASGRRESYEYLASSIPLPELVMMVKNAPSTLRTAAGQLRHTKLLCVNILVKRQELIKHHWFYIYDKEIEASRVSVPSNLAPRSCAQGITALQAEIFRRGDERLEVDAIVEKTITQLSQLLGFNPCTELISATPVLVPYAYVISDHNRQKAVPFILSWLREHKIYTMGLYGKWKFIWSDAAFRSGEVTAKEIKRAMKNGQ